MYNAFPKNKEEFFIYSTIKKEDKYHTGIFKFNSTNIELDNILTNQVDTIYKKENILLYDGYFSQHKNGYLSYAYYNIPEIVLFKNDLGYIKSFVLSDQITLPKIYTRNNSFILSQNFKSFTKGVYLDDIKKKLIIFSNYFQQYDYGILLDYYSLENGKYENSKFLKIKNKLINNSYIQKVYSKDKIKIYSFGDIINI